MSGPLWTGGYADECERCGTPLLYDEEDLGVCDDCAEGLYPSDKIRSDDDGVEWWQP